MSSPAILIVAAASPSFEPSVQNLFAAALVVAVVALLIWQARRSSR